MKKLIIYFAMLCAFACRKYEDTVPYKAPAYLRVFNDIVSTPNPLHNDQSLGLLTFLFDPTFDKDSVPAGAQTVGDFLNQRQIFSLSYPVNAGNSLTAGTNGVGQTNFAQNFDYPGNQHVFTAPSINGFDLSAWAQVPSGKHRIFFMQRPFSNQPFTQLSTLARNQKLIDTTIDLQPGEVYTLESLALDLDQSKYGIYLRRESFIHESFATDSIYANFFNITGKKPSEVQYSDYFRDSLSIYCTYAVSDTSTFFLGGVPTFYTLPFYNNAYFTTLVGRFQQISPYARFPLAPRKTFFDFYGNALNYSSFPIIGFALVNKNQTGSEPGTPNGALNAAYISLICQQDPKTINYNSDGSNIPSPQIGLSPQGGSSQQSFPSLNIVSSVNGKIDVYPSVNLFELVNDHIYLMQVQKLINPK